MHNAILKPLRQFPIILKKERMIFPQYFKKRPRTYKSRLSSTVLDYEEVALNVMTAEKDSLSYTKGTGHRLAIKPCSVKFHDIQGCGVLLEDFPLFWGKVDLREMKSKKKKEKSQDFTQ